MRWTHAAAVTLLTLLTRCISAQETFTDWSSETSTLSADEAEGSSPSAFPPNQFTTFDAEQTPVFVVRTEVCNAPKAVVFPLSSSHPNASFTIVKGELQLRDEQLVTKTL